MPIRPRHGYEVLDTDVTLHEDRQTATVLIDTAGPIDLGLQLSRESLAQLRSQIDSALVEATPHSYRR